MPADILQLLQSGLQHHQSGHLREAEAIYQSILKQQPRQPDAPHLLGVLAHQAGKNDIAVKLIEKAIEIRPGEVEYYSNCGEAYRAQQKYDLALERYQQALAINAGHAGILTNLGNVYKELGRVEDAIGSYEQAIATSPDFAMAHNNLGIVLNELGRTDDAIHHFEQALSCQPGYAEAHSNLGNALQARCRYDDAINHYQRALAIAPGFAEARCNLGNAHRELGRLMEAIDHYKQALAIRPDFAMAHYNLGIALEELGRPEQAIDHYERALAINPDYAEACHNLGFALQELGRTDEAIARYKQALAINPDYAATHLHLSMIDPQPQQLAVIEKRLAGPALSAIDAAHYHFALGNIFNHDEKFDKAFAHYSLGNKHKRHTLSYDANDFSAHVSKLIASYTQDYFEDNKGNGSDSELPVFIIGMPRSGTTLVEQILSSHPRVHGGGELVFIADSLRAIVNEFTTAEPYPECMSACKAEIACRFAPEYLQNIKACSADALRITDKDPGNFHRLGLVRTLFPKARIIHCQRNALDTCTSVFFNYFASGNEYAFDLEELGQYYLDYARLMAHWYRIFSADILPVKYEELVAHQEKISRQIIKHVGLEWDDRCLDFHLNKRAVRTASSVQVRRPLYTRSINRWQYYADHLAPLTAILGQE